MDYPVGRRLPALIYSSLHGPPGYRGDRGLGAYEGKALNQLDQLRRQPMTAAIRAAICLQTIHTTVDAGRMPALQRSRRDPCLIRQCSQRDPCSTCGRKMAQRASADRGGGLPPGSDRRIFAVSSAPRCDAVCPVWWWRVSLRRAR